MSGNAIATQDTAELLVDALASEYVAAVRSAEDARQVQDLRGKAELARMALKKWYRTHERAAEAHKNLLRIDAEALARIYQLGGVDMLRPSERAAARYYATMSDDEREIFVGEWVGKSSAVTAYTAARAADNAAAIRTQGIEDGAISTSRFILPKGYNDPALSEYRLSDQEVYVTGVAVALAGALEERTELGEPFTISDVADELLCRAGYSPDEYTSNDLAKDSAFREGVRRVFREAVRRHSLRKFRGTKLPTFITARIGDAENDGETTKFVRIPIGSARIANLDDAIAIRHEQIRHDQDAVSELESLAEKLRALPGGRDPEATIGDLIAAAAGAGE